MIKAYDNMSAEERKAADKGGALQKAIMEQTDAIKAAEYSTGRFQRNVGNYPKVFDIASTSLGRMLVGLNGFIGTAPGVKGATSAMSAAGSTLLAVWKAPEKATCAAAKARMPPASHPCECFWW